MQSIGTTYRVKYYMGHLDFFGMASLMDNKLQNSDDLTCANMPAFEPEHGASYESYWVDKSWIGGCFLVDYETAHSGFIPGDYEKCIRSIRLKEE